MSKKRKRTGFADVAEVAQRLAVLLGAGVPPGAAWGYLGAAGARIAAAIEAGADVAGAIRAEATSASDRPAWAAIAAAWQVATDAGAPLASTLREFAATLRSLEQIERNVVSALAAPRATARMVMVLPVIGILFGAVLGFNTFGVLVTTPAGLACLASGGVLMLIARGWNRRLVTAAQPDGTIAGLRLDLTALAVAGGAPIERAVLAVDQALTSAHIEGRNVDPAAVDSVLDLSRRAGVPAAELLRSEADQTRREVAAEAERRASVLAVRLMLPLGLCILPAFMILAVVPLLIAVVSSTIGSGFAQ
jgi:tight adherence protein B